MHYTMRGVVIRYVHVALECTQIRDKLGSASPSCSSHSTAIRPPMRVMQTEVKQTLLDLGTVRSVSQTRDKCHI